MIQLLALGSRDRTSRSVWDTMVAAAIRTFTVFAVALSTLAPIAAAPVHAIACPAGAIQWVAGDGTWSDGTSWSGGAAPTATDDACIPSGVTVTINSPASVNQLVSEGSLDIQSLNVLTLGADSETSGLDLQGSIAGAGSLTVTTSGSWTNGTVSGTLIVAGSFNLLGSGGSGSKYVTGTFINNGMVDQSGTHLYSSASGIAGQITNNGNWYFTRPGNGAGSVRGQSSANSGTFTNNGMMERRNAASATREVEFTAQVKLENYGTINVASGRLKATSMTAIGGGVLSADSGGTLWLRARSGTVANVTGASTITGNGAVEWTGGTFELAAGAAVDVDGAFQIDGAEVAGDGVLSVSGDASWINGEVSGNLEVTPSGTLTILGTTTSEVKLLTGSLVNDGTVLHPDPRFDLSTATEAGTVTNNGRWQLNRTSSQFFTMRGDTTNPGSFVNNGTLERIDGSTPAQVIVIQAGVVLLNNGIVSASQGTLQIDALAASNYSGTTLSGGKWEAHGGSSLNLPGAITDNAAHIVLSGDGSSLPDLAGFATNTGIFELQQSADFATLGGFSNTGALVLGNQSAVSDASTLDVSGSFTSGPLSTLKIAVGGLPGDHLFGEVVATGTANLDGTLQAELLGTFFPNPGDSYQVMSYPAVNGTFAAFDIAPFFAADVTGTATLLNGLNPIPISDAGQENYFVDEGSTTDLDGSGSIDPGGAITSYEWQTGAWFDDNTAVQPTFTNTADNGSFDVSLEVCDFEDQCDTDTATVHVDNVNPEVTASIASVDLDEGEAMPVTELATFTDAGILDTHTASIDWGDGDSEAAGTASPISGAHAYPESGTFTITVTITDDDLGTGEATIAANIANVAPTVTPAAPVLDEGDGATTVLLATFTDPGVETFSATMDWGDGASTAVNVDPTTMEVTGTHLYVDNRSYDGEVCVSDGEDGDCQPVTVTVDNVAPTTDITPDSLFGMEGDTFTVDGTYTDPGSADTHTADIDWQDGTIEQDVAVSGNTFSFDHTYTTDGIFSAQVCIEDNDGDSTCDTVEIDVDPIPNVAPEVDAGGPYETYEGTPVGITGTAWDPNGDAFTTEWTSTPGGSIAAPDSLATTFGAAQDGAYTITLAGTDSFGESADDSAQVTVKNVAPSISSLEVSSPLPEGSTANLTATFDDPGIEDVHLATIDWGEEPDPVSATVTDHTITGDNVFEQDGQYTVEVCVSDEHTTSCLSTVITISNVDPIVDAGPDTTIDQGDSVSLDASFTDPGSDDWTASVDWGDGSGVEAATVNADKTLSATHGYDTAGTFTATVCVTDDHGQVCDTFTASMLAKETKAATKPPIADAGGPYSTTEGRRVRLDGRGSSDPDGEIVSYSWTATGGTLRNANTARPKFKAHDNGTYTLTLKVTDDDGLTGTATTTVVVANSAPRVNAGRNATIKKGGKYRLNATFTDRGRADTHSAVIEWGDGQVTRIDDATSPLKKDHKYSKAGKYTVKVTVIDDDGGRHTDKAKVTVKNSRSKRDWYKDWLKKLIDRWRRHLRRHRW